LEWGGAGVCLVVGMDELTCCGSGFIETGSSILGESGSGYGSGSRVLMTKIEIKLQLNFFFISFLKKRMLYTYP
jgi:hypothetical protein